ncbi:hypothetical protein BH790_gp09 [Gordonia phage Gsput1]|uniref:Uncharacterized protein n=1 Tax=Gordonia phage Gsput1 TaxID=1622193 RepID=A0A0E3T6Y2_9CAUD|nr:hypothetical protein BH790_gp09 [Gordonia phage Gsput1]AKC03034.1 hypothetical protein Gsput1_9 [Gordonia phage Gsput1]
MKDYIILRGGSEFRVQLSDEALLLPRYAGAVPVVEAATPKRSGRRPGKARPNPTVTHDEGRASDHNAE